MKQIIRRNKYIEKILEFTWKNIIKVIIGQRRVWKSYIIYQLIDELKTKYNIKDEEIIYINKELVDWVNIKNSNDLYNTIKDCKYIFIDEIQDIKDWEFAIRDLQARWNYDIYITWSNSNLLSGELSTYLSWRYVSFNIYPLDYREFLDFYLKENNEDTFYEYIKFWWLPFFYEIWLKESSLHYLKDIFDALVLKDVISRYSIRNVDFFERLVLYIAQNIWSVFSSKSISNFLKNENINIWANVILNYLKYSCNAMFLDSVSRYDIKWKKKFEVKQKYFFTDIWIRNIIVWWYKSYDISWILENVVYSNLVANFWKVSIWEIKDKEIDFIAEKNGNIIYVQVAYIIVNEETKNREFSAFDEITDQWPKYVITLDRNPWEKINWINYMNIRDFLLNIV